MLSNITWQGYWVTLTFTTAIYYGWVYLTYFKGQLTSLFHRKSGKRSSDLSFSKSAAGIPNLPPQARPPENEEEALFDTPPKDSEEHAAYALMDELSAYLREAKKQRTIKEELLFALGSIIRNYPLLQSSSYQDHITKVLISECQHICSVHLSEEEVVRVWSGA